MFKEIQAYIKAQQGLLAVEVSPSSVPSFLEELKNQTPEESLYFWHLGEGIKASNSDFIPGTVEALGVLNHIEDQVLDAPDQSRYYCLWQLSSHIKENRLVKAKLLSLSFKLKGTKHIILLLDESFDLPDFHELMPILAYSLPSPLQIEEQLSILINQTARQNPVLALVVGEKMVRSCQGLTFSEIGDTFRYSIFKLKEDFSEQTLISEFHLAKMSKLKRLGVEFCGEPEVSVGGIHTLKSWLKRRVALFTSQDASLPQPKGIALVGVPGCGKSLIAKSIGKLLGVPVMRLDMGSLYNSLLGASEQNLRQVLKTAEAIAPVVLFIDELEKAFAGAGSSSSTDNGVSQRLFGTFLTWMQDKTAPVFLVATANRVDGLPPEFLRKGRFDEIFFVDLPTQEERLEIIQFHLLKAKWKISQAGQEWLASATEGYTGSELAYLVTEAQILAFSENRQVQRGDFETVLGEIKPQSETQYERINSIRSWARAYARSAS
jgi:hypothetical protein